MIESTRYLAGLIARLCEFSGWELCLVAVWEREFDMPGGYVYVYTGEGLKN